MASDQPSGLDLANAIAREILHWHEGPKGFWYRYASCTGLKVAKKLIDYPEGGFFRPDRNLFHLGLVKFKVMTDTSAKYKATFPGKDLKVSFNDGRIETCVRDDLTLDDFQHEIGALACYLFVKAWREENRTDG